MRAEADAAAGAPQRQDPHLARLAEELSEGAVDSLPEGALLERAHRAPPAEARPLRVKLGIDPTAPDIHLGHAVVLRKLRQFQDAGHRVVLIIGDYTARVGDPSGRSSLRPMLSDEEIDANAATFQEQAMRILDEDPDRLEVRHNSEWLAMPSVELLKLMRHATAAQLLEREDFAKRMAAARADLAAGDALPAATGLRLRGGGGRRGARGHRPEVQPPVREGHPACLREPPAGDHDDADPGGGGRDPQDVQVAGQPDRDPDPPQEMYGKTMAIPDSAMGEYYRLLLGREPPAGIEEGARAARDAKRELARELVAWLHSDEDGARRRSPLRAGVRAGEDPEEMGEAQFGCTDGKVHLPEVIAGQFGISRSEARRLIDQGGVSLGDAALAAGEHDVPCERADGQVLRVGRRRVRAGLRGRPR